MAFSSSTSTTTTNPTGERITPVTSHSSTTDNNNNTTATTRSGLDPSSAISLSSRPSSSTAKASSSLTEETTSNLLRFDAASAKEGARCHEDHHHHQQTKETAINNELPSPLLSLLQQPPAVTSDTSSVQPFPSLTSSSVQPVPSLLRSFEELVTTTHSSSDPLKHLLDVQQEQHRQQQLEQEQKKKSTSSGFSLDASRLSVSSFPSDNLQAHFTALHYHQQQQLAAATALFHSLSPAALPHNLIPEHLQALSLSPSLSVTPGYSAAVVLSQQQQHQHLIAAAAAANQQHPSLTVQDRPMTAPIYNGVNPNYPGLRVLNTSPPIFAVDQFLTPFECDFLIHAAQDSFGPAPVVGKGSGEISPSRTSSTCYLAREDLPDVMRKVTLLTGKPVEHCELPQVGRYLPSQQYLQHYDAFDLTTEDGRRFAMNGGQRTITCLIYLNHVQQGGATRFPALNLDVQPTRGMALIFFPATVDGMLDKMALHAALPAIDAKFVSQVWIRQGVYSGHPSKRLTQTLGLPFAWDTATAHQQQSHHHHNQQQQQQQQQQLQQHVDQHQQQQLLQQQQNMVATTMW